MLDTPIVAVWVCCICGKSEAKGCVHAKQSDYTLISSSEYFRINNKKRSTGGVRFTDQA